MTIELPREIETELRAVAEKEGRAVIAVIEDAVQQYLDGAAITDLESADVAAVQISVLGDLSYPADFEAGDPK
jgi:predicted transcriptional regulator